MKRLRLLSIVLTLLAATLGANSAAADSPVKHGMYQLDFVAISTPLGHVDLYQGQVADMVARLSSAYSTMTNGQITFALRTLLPPISVSTSIKQSPDIVPLIAQPPADTGVAGVITIGVIPIDGKLPFAGQAYNNNYLLVNHDFNSSFQVIAHEIGHNLGLQHAAAGKCDANGTCTAQEYGDNSDFMGTYTLGNIPGASIVRMSSYRLDQLGILNSSEITYADTTTDISLVPTYGKSPGVKLLYIPIDNQNGYAIEYRPAIGDELQLMATQVPIPGQNMYYPNIPSYGVMVRQLFGFGSDFQSAAPKYSFAGYIDTGGGNNGAWVSKMSVLTVNALNGRQGFDAGASTTLFDGTVISVVKADQNSGALLHIARPASTLSLTFPDSPITVNWNNTDPATTFTSNNQSSITLAKSGAPIPSLAVSFPLPRTSARLISAQLLDNGVVVANLGYSDLQLTAQNTLLAIPTGSLTYTPTTLGTHTLTLTIQSSTGQSVTSQPFTASVANPVLKKFTQLCIVKPGWDSNCQPYPNFQYNVCISLPTGTLYYQSGQKWIAMKKIVAKADSTLCPDPENKYYETISGTYPNSKLGKINFKMISRGNAKYTDLVDTFAVVLRTGTR